MLAIRYSRFKLWMGAAICLGFAALFLWLFLTPNLHIRGWGRLVSGDFGHYFSLPVLTIAFAVFGFRTAWLAAEATDAIVADRHGVTITTIWRSRAAEWRDVMQVRVYQKQIHRSRPWYLVIDRRDAGSLELALAATEASPHAYYELGQTLAQMHLEAIRSPLAKPAPAPAAVPERGPGIPPAAPEFPTRPSFGRKVG